jgi:hypothetical protein
MLIGDAPQMRLSLMSAFLDPDHKLVFHGGMGCGQHDQVLVDDTSDDEVARFADPTAALWHPVAAVPEVAMYAANDLPNAGPARLAEDIVEYLGKQRFETLACRSAKFVLAIRD